jgi:hypothetical protein
MKNPRPRAPIPSRMMGCIVGEGLRARGNKRKEIDLSWNGSISPTIRGRMKKTEYSQVSRGGTGGVSGSSVALLADRGSAPTRSGGSRPSPGRGFSLAMSLKSRETREGPTGPN